jgi:uncharacterized CHY-type Zn-finger protein
MKKEEVKCGLCRSLLTTYEQLIHQDTCLVCARIYGIRTKVDVDKVRSVK